MKRSSYRDGFFLPNELFQLGLDYSEIAGPTPSIKTIRKAVV